MSLRLVTGVDLPRAAALPRLRPPARLVGLDLGQRRDWTALAIVDRRDLLRPDPDPQRPAQRVAAYDVVHLDRTRERSYEAVVDDVAGLTRRGDMAGARLVIDETGVGAAVGDMLEARRLRPERVTIHGGTEATTSGRSHRVPKRDLATAVAVVLESRRLKVAEALPLASVLTEEMGNFKVKVSLATGHDSYGADNEWRESAHDDLVLAVALAVWFGEHEPDRRVVRS